MNVSVEKLPKSLLKLTVELSVDEMQPYLERAAEALSKQHKIEGFRPGKASLGIVMQKLGAAAVWEQAAEIAVRKSYPEAIKQQNIQSVGSPKISVHTLAPDNPFSYQAEVATMPEIKLGEYQKVKVAKDVNPVKPEQIEKALSDLQQMFAKEAAADRPAQSGDKVEVDFALTMDGQPVEGGSSKQHPVTIGGGQFIPGFEDQLVGTKPGDHKEFDLQFPKDYHNPDVAGKTGHFAVDVKSVLQVEKPALDDAFAKQASKYQTLAELKQQIEKNLADEADQAADRKHELAIIDKLIAETKFGELPEMLIENEVHKMRHELAEEVERRGLKFPDYLQSIKKSEEDLLKEFKPQAEKRVKSALLLRAIAKAENIGVDPAEIDAEVQQALKTYEQYPDLKAQIESDDYRDFAKVMLTNRKVVGKLKAWAVAA